MTEPTTIWGLDPRIWQAIIAGVFVAAGWLVNGWQNRRATASEAQHVRDDAAAQRAERLRDVHRALYAEIGANLSNLESVEALNVQRVSTLELMQSDPDYVPFLGRENRNLVFQAIVSEINILPRTSIDAVVAYYAQLASIDAMTEDLRGQTFANLSVDRRSAIYSDYMEMKIQALSYGNHALLMINEYAKGGHDAAQKLDAKLKREALSNRRAEDPSDP